MSWTPIIDMLVENAPAELSCPTEGCGGIPSSPTSTAENGYYGDGNVWCACCGYSREVSEETLEWADILEFEFREAGY